MKTISSNHLGSFTLNNCEKLSIKNAMKQVKVTQMKSILESMFSPEIKIYETLCHFGGKRYWFSCPVCSRRVFVLYKHPLQGHLACRQCTGLKYRKQRYKGMIEETVQTQGKVES